jgi:flagellar hook-associated protein FlgK
MASAGTTGAAFFTRNRRLEHLSQPGTGERSIALVQASGLGHGDRRQLRRADNWPTWRRRAQSTLNNQTFGDSYGCRLWPAWVTRLQTANTQVTNQTAVANMLATQQSSVGGVNIDQEMTNLMGFQRAYEASAELVTTSQPNDADREQYENRSTT